VAAEELLLDDPDSFVRIDAAHALGALGRGSSDSALLAVLAGVAVEPDENPIVRRAAYEAARDVRGFDPRRRRVDGPEEFDQDLLGELKQQAAAGRRADGALAPGQGLGLGLAEDLWGARIVDHGLDMHAHSLWLVVETSRNGSPAHYRIDARWLRSLTFSDDADPVSEAWPHFELTGLSVQRTGGAGQRRFKLQADLWSAVLEVECAAVRIVRVG
jgi:hypothetical protein